jgi:site-specific DNA-methyltransferase (adenine-specific)
MFGGSGATGWAAASEGRECHLIERDPGYAAHIRARLGDFDPDKLAEPSSAAKHLSPQPDLFGG